MRDAQNGPLVCHVVVAADLRNRRKAEEKNRQQPGKQDDHHGFTPHGYFHSPLSAATIVCHCSGVAAAASTGAPTARAISENGLGRRPSLRLKKLPQRPRSASGTTGTGF